MNVRKLALIVVVCAFLALVAGCAPVPQAAPPTATPVPPSPTPVPPSPTPVPQSPTPEPAPTAQATVAVPDILTAYQDAFNRGDSDAVLALFVDLGMNFIDLHFIDTSDKRSMRDYLEMQMEAGGVLKFQDCMLDGDKYACTMLAHDDCAEAMGIVDVQNDLVVELADGKIKVMSITVDPNDWRKFTDEFLPKFSEWVKANRPADWARITSGVNNREVGKVQSEVCKAYIASQAGGATAPVPDILKAYQDAYNQHNADAVLALFVDNGLSFVDSGSLNTGDKGTLRKYLEYQMALGTVQTVKECTLDGDKYRCTLLVHDDCSPVLVALGIFKQNQEVQEDLVVGSKDGKMQTMEITMSPDDMLAQARAVTKITPWMEANRPDDWTKMMSGAYNQANGKVWSEVCKAYTAAQK